MRRNLTRAICVLTQSGLGTLFCNETPRRIMTISCAGEYAHKDSPRIADLARQTGSSFTTEKVEPIHLTGLRKGFGKESIDIDGKSIRGGDTPKLLGVVFTQAMR